MGHPTKSPEELLHDYVAVWNEGDYEILQDVVSSDFIIVDPGAPDGRLAGREKVESYLRELRTGFPDLRISMRETLTNDDIIMVKEYSVNADYYVLGHLQGNDVTLYGGASRESVLNSVLKESYRFDHMNYTLGVDYLEPLPEPENIERVTSTGATPVPR